MPRLSEQNRRALHRALTQTFPASRLITDPLRRRTWGSDASFYFLVPELVVQVETADEVVTLLRACREHRAPVTFRAAGTSLSGQAITDSVLAVLGEGWAGIRILDGGERITLGPGVRGGEANRLLAPLGRKIGPDPASLAAAMIGGIAANNASGMCCGTSQNSYRTLSSLKLILADGTRLDTGDPQSVRRFRRSHASLLASLDDLARDTRRDPRLSARIERKYRIKNTTGYSLNALVDFEDPVDVLAHLMIGSEGTLGFLEEITLLTVPEDPYRASAMIFFESPPAAAEAVMRLRGEPVAAVELIDRAGLRSAEGRPGMPARLSGLGPRATALLLEVTGAGQEERDRRAAAVRHALSDAPALEPVEFSDEPATCGAYWAVRKGLYPMVGALRRAGTTVVIEDVAFPVEQLRTAIEDLQELFERHGYSDAIVFGHARDGNLHVCFAQDFSTASEVARYARFMDALVELVVDRYDGSLKAEHGTGRNMAPFVEREWGRQALDLMYRIKDLLDPAGILNPGVVLDDDPQIHLRDLKPMPIADAEIDRCVECGFCERLCPSGGLTLTPRQRIVGARRLRPELEDREERLAMEQLYLYQGLDTCAACGLCQSVCPVEIDTGAFVKRQRTERVGPRERNAGRWAADHFDQTTEALRLGLRAAHLARAVLGPDATRALERAARALRLPGIPEDFETLPDGRRFVPPPDLPPRGPAGSLVYFPSCSARNLGSLPGPGAHDPLPAVITRLLRRSGFGVAFPPALDHLCCGLAFASKGLAAEADRKMAETLAALRAAAPGTPLTVLSDTSACSERLRELREDGIRVVDLTEFLHDEVLPRVHVHRRAGRIAVHPTCSTRSLGLEVKLLAIANACADEVVRPVGVDCCGFAGDRGFTHPELTAHALRHLRSQLDGVESAYSSSPTCEIGLSRHCGVTYRSIALLLDACSRSS